MVSEGPRSNGNTSKTQNNVENKQLAPEMHPSNTYNTANQPDITDLVQTENIPETELNDENTQELNPTDNDTGKGQLNINSGKAKPKKPIKNQGKVRKEEVIDKTYILDLESQINVLKSTLDLYKKSVNSDYQRWSLPPTYTYKSK